MKFWKKMVRRKKNIFDHTLVHSPDILTSSKEYRVLEMIKFGV